MEPKKVAARFGNVAIHCTFYAAGVNHFWAMDQHDKWKHFGLFWHGCMDGFSGKILLVGDLVDQLKSEICVHAVC